MAVVPLRRGLGRPPLGDAAMLGAEHQARYRARLAARSAYDSAWSAVEHGLADHPAAVRELRPLLSSLAAAGRDLAAATGDLYSVWSGKVRPT